MPVGIRDNLANLIRNNPTAKTVITPHMNMYFPEGIRPVETSLGSIILFEKISGMYVEIDLRSFSSCYLRANEICIF